MFIIKKEFRYIISLVLVQVILLTAVIFHYNLDHEKKANITNTLANITNTTSLVFGSSFLEHRYIEQKHYSREISSQLPKIDYNGFLHGK